MIMIPMDEAGAFDALSILQVKAEHLMPVKNEIQSICHAISAVIGDDLYSEIRSSNEYEKLMRANEKMWDIQERSMRDGCRASDVDKQNQARYHAKRELQKAFFGTELTEKKSIRPYEK